MSSQMRVAFAILALLLAGATADMSAPSPLAPVPTTMSEGPSWSFRILEGSSRSKGLLQVLPPHEVEWGTVCGDTGRFKDLVHAGKSAKTAAASFFSPRDALVACRSAGYPTSVARAYPMKSGQGWGTGPLYMSHVNCGGAGGMPRQKSLAECYFTLTMSSMLQNDCDHGDDVYIDCSGDPYGGEEMVDDQSSANDQEAMKDPSQQEPHEGGARRSFGVLSLYDVNAVPTSMVLVVDADKRSATQLATDVANAVSESSGRVRVQSAGPNATYNNVTYAYFNATFLVGSSVTTPSPSAASGATTAAPAPSSPQTLMLRFLEHDTGSEYYSPLSIVEIRIDTSNDYGTLSATNTMSFKLEPLNSLETTMANTTSTSGGYIRGLTDASGKVGAAIGYVNATTRFITASHVCGALGLDTIPSLLIPNFGVFNYGMLGISDLRIVSVGVFSRQVSQYYSKQNSFAMTDAYGILCGEASFQDEGWPQTQFCVSTLNNFDTFRAAVERELLIPAYRIRLTSSNSDTFCFRFGYSYAFKNNGSMMTFDIYDLQYIFGNLNTKGWTLLTAMRRSSEPTPVPFADYLPVQEVLVTFRAKSNITGAILKAWLLKNLTNPTDGHALDPEDIVIDSEVMIPGTLPSKPEETPTPAVPIPPTDAPTRPPLPTRWNRKNKTMSHSNEVTITEEQTFTVSADLTPTKYVPASTNAPNTTLPPPSTDAPPEMIREIVLRFMFYPPAMQTQLLLEANAIFPWGVFPAAPPMLITPAPPPPDTRGMIAGVALAGLVLLVILAIVAIIIKRKFYTRTPNRWDDDYVMMNTRVLTIPLNQIDHETPKRKKSQKVVYPDEEEEEEETADLF